MKKVVVAIVILAVILTAGILENVYIDRLFDKLDNRLATLEELIIAQDDGAVDAAEDLQKWWDNQRKYAELFVYSPDIRAFSVAIGETQGSLECGDFDNALSKVRSLMVMSRNIHNILDFNASDII
ncbi:MAG: DUF4363 family protein [Bacteroides sp.]|nr:DUF4363 family protein [Bacillota bacterium]MCM1394325.1 DUF4363 family protein [[Eubacterium] siraeum]MCM1454983.1 DUF4363 family protein [Bacteroides sp.]